MTHIEALDLDHVPEHLVVLGGGYVGLGNWRKPYDASAHASP